MRALASGRKRLADLSSTTNTGEIITHSSKVSNTIKPTTFIKLVRALNLVTYSSTHRRRKETREKTYFKVRCESNENHCLLSSNITSGNRPVRQPNHSGSRQPSWGTRTESAGPRRPKPWYSSSGFHHPNCFSKQRSTEKRCPSSPQT